jgi:hypothetical protein
MSSSVAALRRRELSTWGTPIARRRRRRTGSAVLTVPQMRQRSIRRRINAAWGLLYLNTLTFIPGGLVPLPSRIGQALTQGALLLAILVALTVNPKIKVRPNVFLCLVCMLAVDTVITTLLPQHIGTVYRTIRLAEFVTALWLLTPWWGRRDLLLLRFHLRWLYVALGSVLLGLLIAPGHAFAQNGRLSGVLWPMPPTQVAQYAAVAAGVTVVLWLARTLSGRVTLAGVAPAVAIVVLTHTRTALLSLVVGILVAGLSLFTINARVRRVFAATIGVVSLGVITLAGVAATWLARGETTKGLTTLTGRTDFWALVLKEPRTIFQEIFGFGLSNASINGLPIDSNWLASYMMEGFFGVVVCALILVFLFAAALFQPRGVRRALALFLVSYCTLASITEVGFADASTYMLHLAVAASLLIPHAGSRTA